MLNGAALAPLVRPDAPALAAQLSAVQNTSLFVVSLAYPADAMRTKLGGFGHLIPASEGLTAIGVRARRARR